MSETITWIVSATFLDGHRPPTDESHAEQAWSNPGQLPEPTEKRQGDAGDVGLSKQFQQ